MNYHQTRRPPCWWFFFLHIYRSFRETVFWHSPCTITDILQDHLAETGRTVRNNLTFVCLLVETLKNFLSWLFSNNLAEFSYNFHHFIIQDRCPWDLARNENQDVVRTINDVTGDGLTTGQGLHVLTLLVTLECSPFFLLRWWKTINNRCSRIYPKVATVHQQDA